MHPGAPASLALVLLVAGCLGIPSDSPEDEPGEEPPVSADLNRTFPGGEGPQVWYRAVDVLDLEDARNFTVSLPEGNSTSKIVANMTIQAAETDPVYVALISQDNATVHPAFAKVSNPNLAGGSTQTYDAPLRTDSTGEHLLVVAYEGSGVELEVETEVPLEALGSWQESSGNLIVFDDRPVDENRSYGAAGGGSLPGAYTYSRTLSLEGSVFVHSMHLLSEGTTRVSVDGAESWTTESTRTQADATVAKGYILRLPPGEWTTSVEVHRTDGFQSTVVLELPEGPPLGYEVTVQFEEESPQQAGPWLAPGLAAMEPQQ